MVTSMRMVLLMAVVFIRLILRYTIALLRRMKRMPIMQTVPVFVWKLESFITTPCSKIEQKDEAVLVAVFACGSA